MAEDSVDLGGATEPKRTNEISRGPKEVTQFDAASMRIVRCGFLIVVGIARPAWVGSFTRTTIQGSQGGNKEGAIVLNTTGPSRLKKIESAREIADWLEGVE